MSEIDLDQGTVQYSDSGGDGPVIVLIHGLLVNGSLWRDVVPLLSENARVVVPELPMGSHRIPMKPDADLTPPGVARLIADFLDALDLRDVTLIGNDTGGAMCQLVATRHPERLARFVLTNCDSHKNFLPPMFRPLQWITQVPGVARVIARGLQIPALRRLPMAYGWLTRTEVDRERSDSWVGPMATIPGVRRDVVKLLGGIHPRYTVEAATKLRAFDRPTMLIWGRKDRFFTRRHAEKLAAEFADARLVWVEDSATFVPVDAPDRLAGLVRDFVHRPVGSR
ncbi:alpha/beta fold hydrolase [Pseudonocardia spinosispora]|uniref:alpha/beta fold hydrolase n=1 Tax=Pseudonocardia spinosispora TaxID=103441 RepID=UPI0004913104|nr:alpha/beta hydrolase [Pseudonocardia spinosispora]